MQNQESNEYLNQVLAEQQRVDRELKGYRPGTDYDINLDELEEPAPAGAAAPTAKPRSSRGPRFLSQGVSDAVDLRPRDYRITGFWLWKTVVVAPNVYVIHTRRDHEQPLHIGMGISFRYRPWTDSFLVIPAAVQTLLIAARCICRERQGILVQAYVQWVVEDIQTAYRKLDFSDPQDPMRVVNVQLREQAEAAIKDKVATMSIDDVLSDKQPIIEELTHRLRTVAEGSREAGASSGLGLKIVTVQIKEAVVSSTRVWENLQKPFRAERERTARLAELETQRQVANQEMTNRQAHETAELENMRQLAQLRAEQEREVYDRDQTERARRHQVEQQAEQHAIAERTATERARRQSDLELALQGLVLEGQRIAQELDTIRRRVEMDQVEAEREKLRTAAAVELENVVHQAQMARSEREVAVFQMRRAAENELSDQHVRAQLISRLPEIAAALPKPEELRTVTIGADGDGATASLVGLLASIF
jgi:hypothetical protein